MTSPHINISSGLGFPPDMMSDLFESLKMPIAVGWSYGGLKAIQLAAENPKDYKALILISSSPCFGQRPDWPGIHQMQQKRFLKKLNGPQNEFINYYLKLVSHPNPGVLSLRRPIDIMKVKSQIDRLFTADLRSEFAALRIPILIIHGEHDAIVPCDTARCLKKLNSQAKIMLIKDAGHAPFMSHQSDIKKVIHDFLAG